MNVVIIIPTYNEEACIGKTVTELQTVLSKIQGHHIQVLIFDSHSQDQTLARVQELQQRYPNIVLQTEARKSGLGHAYVAAMQYAMKHMQADLIFEFDADGSHQPQYIPQMIDAITEGADVVVGSRYVKGGKIDVSWPWYRLLVSKLGNWIARFFLTWRYKDFTSGFRVSKAAFLAPALAQGLLSKNYAYKLHLFWSLHKLKAKIVELPITFIDREQGYSKFPRNNIRESLKVVILLRLREFKHLLFKLRCRHRKDRSR